MAYWTCLLLSLFLSWSSLTAQHKWNNKKKNLVINLKDKTPSKHEFSILTGLDIIPNEFNTKQPIDFLCFGVSYVKRSKYNLYTSVLASPENLYTRNLTYFPSIGIGKSFKFVNINVGISTRFFITQQISSARYRGLRYILNFSDKYNYRPFIHITAGKKIGLSLYYSTNIYNSFNLPLLKIGTYYKL